ncbi:TetR/AcrR family transcriptional regulator [Streptosporangium sp. CA-135522]|uniref:TetR/AcrR family transcriptional regulator n=1 Tax=Streptosporangium sp. CA-135522 TaxID=3240072 RepID=UPI003D8A2DAE
MTKASATSIPARRPTRADARRNHDRIRAAAGEVIAEHGADASLEEIARRAGVGSATLHRHFPSRQALLEAVFRERVEILCARAGELLTAPSPGSALVTWLRAVVSHAAANRGLAASLMPGARNGRSELGADCHAMITNAGGALLTRAQQAGAIRREVAIADLLKLVHAISLATENEPDHADQADRLLALVVKGVQSCEPVGG